MNVLVQPSNCQKCEHRRKKCVKDFLNVPVFLQSSVVNNVLADNGHRPWVVCNATYFAVCTPLSMLSSFLYSEYRHYEYAFRPPYTPDIGEGGTDNLECWYSLTPSCVGVYSCFIALGASEIRNNFIIVPTNRPPLADESTPSMAYSAIDACQSTPTAVSASRDVIYINRGRYPRIYLFCKGMAEN
eukprot:6177064-Pleurochrysis_carterae.AAC.3